MTRHNDWDRRFWDAPQAGSGTIRPFGAVSEEERAIMDEILNEQPMRTTGDALGGALVGLFETWAGRTLDGGPLRDAELSALPYPDYLQTDHWRATRHRKLMRAGWTCQRCQKSNVRLDVHHLTYVRRGREREEDLIVLCRTCHAAEHATEEANHDATRPTARRPAKPA